MESWKCCWLLAPVNIWSCCGCICAILSYQKPFFSRQSEGVDPKSSRKSHKSYFCLSFILIFNSFFTALFVTSLRSRVDHQCQFTTQFLHEIVWSYHGNPWTNAAGFCPLQKSDFHQRSAPSLSSRRPLIQLHFFVCCYTTCLTSLTSWITSVVASARCDTPVVIHHVIWPRYPTIDLFS